MITWFVQTAPIRQKLFVAFTLCVLVQLAGGVAGLLIPSKDLILIVAGFIASGVLSLTLCKMIADPYVATVIEMETLAGGNLDVEMTRRNYKDCVGRLSRAMAVFRDSTAQGIALAKKEETHAQQQAVIVNALASGLKALAAGDLQHRINASFPSEYEQLRADFNAAMDNLADIMVQVSSSADSIKTGSAEISSASDDLSRRTEHQAASLAESAASMDQVTAMVRETAAGAGAVRSSVAEAHGDATKGGKVVQDAIVAMDGIERSSQEIAQIISVIDGIAFQTNLLALNAGVEAARAGDAGKGFAVVANEVRALAQRSADAAKDIKALITASSKQVESGVQLVGETGRMLANIVAKVGEISGAISVISASTETQAANLQQVNGAVGDMDKMTQQNAAMVEESTAAARSLAAEADHLAELVTQFDLGHGGGSAPARNNRNVRTIKSAPRAKRASAPLVHGNLALAQTQPADDSDWTEF
ncbi:methyl-accepting chemotaxis protein [Sphingomonas sp. AP4-R1]|uniref:methyl-accepting chemotaxis protein n=1 Tax=Sphingomonas sp. AP4-R1 TaxID=2735134 RepID=UPI0014937A6D|nr:methyl-accepting chemotaxis protein [Sphingomonas sp. AP4-R1]QJU57450.1 methyl-accepting chemotaxis protein [Sphingomonas sp. AP4-R1]